MIKDIERLKKEIKDKYTSLTSTSLQPEWERVVNMKLDTLFGLIDQHDEPEKVVVPSFVAEWIVKCKGRNWTLSQAYSRLNNETLNVIKWLYHEGDMNRKANLFARAWLAYPNIEVEQEKKFYVLDKDNRTMLCRKMDGKTITTADSFLVEDMYEVEKKSHQLTEKEIKDYDPKYMAFAVPVEEEEE